MELIKYISVLKFIVHYMLAGSGKLIGYLVAPLVYPHRDWLRNYIWNWMQVNGIKCNRSTIWAEDEFKELVELNLKPTPEQLLMQQKAEAKLYLNSTDWYVTRFTETGEEIPEEVAIKREEARALI